VRDETRTRYEADGLLNATVIDETSYLARLGYGQPWLLSTQLSAFMG
jgi:hypothetical protein